MSKPMPQFAAKFVETSSRPFSIYLRLTLLKNICSLDIRQWNYKALTGYENNNQKQSRFYLITNSCILNYSCSFSQ